MTFNHVVMLMQYNGRNFLRILLQSIEISSKITFSGAIKPITREIENDL